MKCIVLVASIALGCGGEQASTVAETLEGVRYQLHVPADYELSKRDGNKHLWTPRSGTGLTFRIRVAHHGRVGTGGDMKRIPCKGWSLSEGEGGELDGGTERTRNVSALSCIPGTELMISCRGSHTRGHLEPAEKDPARAVCKTLAVVANN